MSVAQKPLRPSHIKPEIVDRIRSLCQNAPVLVKMDKQELARTLYVSYHFSRLHILAAKVVNRGTLDRVIGQVKKHRELHKTGRAPLLRSDEMALVEKRLLADMRKGLFRVARDVQRMV
jgi:hypothetical protein